MRVSRKYESRSKKSSTPKGRREREPRVGENAGAAFLSAFRRRLVSAAASRDEPLQVLAHKAGIAPSTFYFWVQGRTGATVEKLARFAEATGVRLAWLVAGDGSMHDFTPPAGYHLPATELPAVPLALSDELWQQLVALAPQRSGHFRLLEMPDDTMEPTIRAGDFVLVEPLEMDRTAASQPSGIYVLGPEIRRVEWRFADQVAVISADNPKYRAKPRLIPFRNVRLRAKVLWRAGRI
jgi:transcriptional regulator with XRE-family HTH domain